LQHEFLETDKARKTAKKPKALEDRVAPAPARASHRLARKEKVKAVTAAAAYTGPRRIPLREALAQLLPARTQPTQGLEARPWRYTCPGIADIDQRLKEKYFAFLISDATKKDGPRPRVPALRREASQPDYFLSIEALKSRIKIVLKEKSNAMVEECLREQNAAEFDRIL
jgi:hypothetical protein